MDAATPSHKQVRRRRAPAAVLPLAPSLARRRLQSYLMLLVGDMVALFAGFCGAGYLYLGEAGTAQSAQVVQLLLPLFLTVALYNGAYSMATLLRAGHGIARALAALGVATVFFISVAFYTRSSLEFSRLSLAFGAAAGAVAIVWLRLQLRAFVRWRCAGRIINELVIDDGGPVVILPGAFTADAAALGLVPRFDDPAALDRIGLVLQNMDRVAVACPANRRAAWALLLKGANIEGEVLDDAVLELGARGARVVGDHGFLRVSTGPLGLRGRAAKRLFDLALAVPAIVLLAPLMLAVGIAIKLADGGPVLFVQRRVGRGNRFFAMFKFRSMAVAGADSDGLHSTIRGDSRVTRVGRWIRRTSIDELPQLFNVLLGNMSCTHTPNPATPHNRVKIGTEASWIASCAPSPKKPTAVPRARRVRARRSSGSIAG